MSNNEKSAFSTAFGSLGGALGNVASGGLASAADSFLGGVSNAIFGGITAKRDWKYKQKEMALQQQYNLENMQKQYDYQLDFWNKNNQYNDPANATARWRAAGISPQAVYGSGAQGAGVSGGSVSVPNSDNPKASGVDQRGFAGMTLAEAAMMRNQQRITDADVKVKEAEARLKNSQAVDQEWKNTLQPQFEREQYLLISKMSSDASKSAVEAAWADFMAACRAGEAVKALQEYDARIEELKSRKVLNDAEADAAKASANKMNEEAITEKEKRPWEIDSLQRGNALKTSEAALNWYRIRVLGPSDKSRIDADTDEAKARARKVDAEIERIAKMNGYTDEQIKYLKHLRALGWAKFGVSTLKAISEEARGWFKEGSKAGSVSNWIVDDEALGAIAATL